MKIIMKSPTKYNGKALKAGDKVNVVDAIALRWLNKGIAIAPDPVPLPPVVLKPVGEVPEIVVAQDSVKEVVEDDISGIRDSDAVSDIPGGIGGGTANRRNKTASKVKRVNPPLGT